MKKLVLVLSLVFGASDGAEIGYKSDTNYLWIVGTIESGDADRVEKALSSPPQEDETIGVRLASSGGDVVEAMKIGRILRDGFIPTAEDTEAVNGMCFSAHVFTGQMEDRDAESCGCYSSCFVIWSGGPYRSGGAFIDGGLDGIGIHRPRFDADYFAGLSASEAEEEYGEITDLVMQYLNEMGIPNDLAEKMFSVSSENIYLLSDSEIEDLRSPPAIDEWLISKCGKMSEGDQNDFRSYGIRDIQGKDDGKEYLPETERRRLKLLREKRFSLACKGDAIRTEQVSRRRVD